MIKEKVSFLDQADSLGIGWVELDGEGNIISLTDIDQEGLGMQDSKAVGKPLEEFIQTGMESRDFPLIKWKTLFLSEEWQPAWFGCCRNMARPFLMKGIETDGKNGRIALLEAPKSLTDWAGLDSSGSCGYVFIKTEEGFERIDTGDILFVEANENYSNVITRDQKYLVHTPMKKLEEKLSCEGFKRVHRSYIVHPAQIERFDENGLSIQGHLVPVGRAYRKNLLSEITFL